MLLYIIIDLCYNVFVKKLAHYFCQNKQGDNNMNYKRFLAGAMVFALAVCTTGCADKKENDTIKETEELVEPVPVDCTEPNAVIFDNDLIDFAEVKSVDPDSAKGTLSIVEVKGNKMLKFTDDNTVPLDGKVQKISINATKLLGNEGAAKVRSIEFDLYAQATADHLKTDDADGVRAPGWIGGGGGTVTAVDNKWYDFQEFEGGEYNFETSGAVHAKFKFLLADSGQCWSEEMEDANFLIMRWGIANESDMLIDNIIFYDEDGNSIPLAEKYFQGIIEMTDDLKKQFEEAEKLGEEVNAQAQDAIEEASRLIEEKKNQ
jgi:hypothetical protein